MEIKLSQNMEDYLEAILLLEKRQGNVRVKEIARELQITMPSVSSAIKNLEKQGLVCHPRYDLVGLTETGNHIANEIYRRHQIIKSFLFDVLGLDSETAEKDACGMEHAMSSKTLERLSKFMEKNHSEH